MFRKSLSADGHDYLTWWLTRVRRFAAHPASSLGPWGLGRRLTGGRWQGVRGRHSQGPLLAFAFKSGALRYNSCKVGLHPFWACISRSSDERVRLRERCARGTEHFHQPRRPSRAPSCLSPCREVSCSVSLLRLLLRPLGELGTKGRGQLYFVRFGVPEVLTGTDRAVTGLWKTCISSEARLGGPRVQSSTQSSCGGAVSGQISLSGSVCGPALAA